VGKARICVIALMFALPAVAWWSFVSSGPENASASTCPNEGLVGFRTYLAGCRAYEMVSPPFKDGLALQEVLTVTNDGSSLLANSLGTFAGSESDIFNAYYELARSPSGWTVTAIDPPASQFPASLLFAASSVDATTLWATRTVGQPFHVMDLYIRDGRGNFTKVGSAAPPSAESGPPAGPHPLFGSEYSYAGASADLDHVLFNIESGRLPVRWPGDTTDEEGNGTGHGPALYEYAGVAQTHPNLVGVSDGSTVVEGRNGGLPLPAGTLISNCRTSLGSDGSEDVDNAVAEDGSAVLFTARGRSQPGCENPAVPPVNELYVRRNGMQTIPISEPLRSECRACNTESKKSAEFVGASADGSKGFFISEQELLAGAAGQNLYEYDFDEPPGERLSLISTGAASPEVEGVARVSQDGSHVYFVAGGTLTTGPNAEGREPIAGRHNLYVFARTQEHPHGHLAFIATLSSEDGEDWSARDVRPVQSTRDGQFVVFDSVGNLTGGDTGNQPQIFEYDAATEELVRVSVGEPGYAQGREHANAHGSEIRRQQFKGAFLPAEATNNIALSSNGADVVFSSVAALVASAVTAEASNGTSVYEYRSSGRISDGRVYLVSDGSDATQSATSGSGATLMGIDETGADIFFDTAAPLVEQDTDTQFDVYDARVDGGFSRIGAASACAGCGATSSSTAAFPSPATVGQAGEVDAPPAPVSSAVTEPKPRRASLQQQLSKALQDCRRKRARRKKCEAVARQHYRASIHARRGAQ
jgi:hypothetical protein